MGLKTFFSQRQAALSKAKSDTIASLSYELPDALRNQIVYILTRALGRPTQRINLMDDSYLENLTVWENIVYAVAEARGVMRLGIGSNAYEQCLYCIQREKIDLALDVIECAFQIVAKTIDFWDGWRGGIAGLVPPTQAIEDLNARFVQHGVGYRFENGELMKTPSAFLHKEVISPALARLGQEKLVGPLHELMTAFRHFRKREHKQAIGLACDAFESTMKAVCLRQKWPFPPTAQAKDLIDICFKKGLIPAYLEGEFMSVRGVLESGLPTVRNREGSHGSGPQVKEVDEYLVGFALNIAASNIMLLLDAEKSL